MARIFVTGASAGIGQQISRRLVAAGHRVVLHARNQCRAADARRAVPEAVAVVTGDLSVLAEIRMVAMSASALGPYDVVVHNAGVGGRVAERQVTRDGGEWIFTVNVIAPYLLTALMPLPQRLVYVASGRESAGRVNLTDPNWENRPWNGMQAYWDSKLYDVMLALAAARRYQGVAANAVDPGWVRTKMGGPGAPGSIAEGADTPVWLAVSDEPEALASGRLVRRRAEVRANPVAYDVAQQEALLDTCAGLTGMRLWSRNYPQQHCLHVPAE